MQVTCQLHYDGKVGHVVRAADLTNGLAVETLAFEPTDSLVGLRADK